MHEWSVQLHVVEFHIAMTIFGRVARLTEAMHACIPLQKLKGSFNLPRVISVAASWPDNVQTSADQQIVLLNPFMEAQ